MRRSPTFLALPLSLLASIGPLVAQTLTTDAFRDLPPPSKRDAPAPTPKLLFQLLAEIPLPGPLPGGPPRWVGDRIEIPVAGGTARADPIPGATALVETLPPGVRPDDVPDEWSEDERSRFRYRALPEGAILAQRRCRRCADGWKKAWRLRVAGTTAAPPLVSSGRVCFGAMDNRIYCVRAKNGHRRWVRDIGGRISTPLVLWKGRAGGNVEEGPLPEDDQLSLILVVPDGGSQLLALGGETGVELATARLAANQGKLVGMPLITPDGRIVIARQKYSEAEASLMVYELRELSPSDADAGQRNVEEQARDAGLSTGAQTAAAISER